jgi:hypothetical protein
MRSGLVPRLIAASAALTIAAVTLTSCGVPQHGITGVMIAPSGRLTAVLGWCPDHAPDALVLYTDAERQSTVGVSHWSAAQKPAGTYLEVPLAEPPPGWSAKPPRLPALDPRREYILYGATRNNSSSTAHVHFTVAALQALTPGTILAVGEYVPEKDAWAELHVSAAEFQRQVRKRYGC